MRTALLHHSVLARIARTFVAPLLVSVSLAACTAEIGSDANEYAVHEESLQFAQVGSLVSMEAEDFTTSSLGTGMAANSRWTRTTSIAGYSGGAALLATPNTGVNVGDSSQGPRLNYTMTMTQTGTHYVWVRLRGTSTNDDAVHVGVNGTLISWGALGVADASGAWRWKQYAGSRRLAFAVAAPGVVSLNVWMREDGVALDKILVTRDAAYVPSGTGPAQTPVV